MNLGHNSLHHVPTEALKSATFLRRVVLGGNAMAHLEEGALSHVNVGELDLNHLCRLKTVGPGAFSSLPMLTKLEINHNPHLVYVSPAFAQNLTRLQRLEIAGNGLVALDEISSQAFPSLRVLDVRNNRFACSCYLSWLLSSSFDLVNKSEVSCVDDGRNWTNVGLFTDGTAIKGSQANEVHQKICPPQLYPLFPDHKSAMISEHVSFQCAAFGRPEPRVSWVFGGNGSAVPYRESCSGIVGPCQTNTTAGMSKLSLRFLRPSDAGVYRCVATGHEGRR